jgi:hypothetical protein
MDVGITNYEESEPCTWIKYLNEFKNCPKSQFTPYVIRQKKDFIKNAEVVK